MLTLRSAEARNRQQETFDALQFAKAESEILKQQLGPDSAFAEAFHERFRQIDGTKAI